MEKKELLYIFGSRLKKVREEEGLTKAELARKLGVSVNSIRNWENGTADIKLRYILRISRLFSGYSHYLFGSFDNKK